MVGLLDGVRILDAARFLLAQDHARLSCILGRKASLSRLSVDAADQGSAASLHANRAGAGETRDYYRQEVRISDRKRSVLYKSIIRF